MLKVVIFAALVAYCVAIPVDNGVEGDPEIECGPTSLTVNFNTQNEFEGHVYVKGLYGSPGCRNDEGGRQVAGITLPFDSCGVNRQRSLNPKGVFVSTTVIISFHPLFLTKVDRAYRIQCFYMEADKTVDTELEVSMLTTAFQSQAVPMPVCRYEILDGGPTGDIITFAIVGQQVYHKWTCDTETVDTFCMIVHSCYVDDNNGDKEDLVGADGCATDIYLLNNPEYPSDLTAGVEAHVFKYADRPQLYFQCQVTILVKEPGNECPRPACAAPAGRGGPRPAGPQPGPNANAFPLNPSGPYVAKAGEQPVYHGPGSPEVKFAAHPGRRDPNFHVKGAVIEPHPGAAPAGYEKEGGGRSGGGSGSAGRASNRLSLGRQSSSSRRGSRFGSRQFNRLDAVEVEQALAGLQEQESFPININVPINVPANLPANWPVASQVKTAVATETESDDINQTEDTTETTETETDNETETETETETQEANEAKENTQEQTEEQTSEDSTNAYEILSSHEEALKAREAELAAAIEAAIAIDAARNNQDDSYLTAIDLSDYEARRKRQVEFFKSAAGTVDVRTEINTLDIDDKVNALPKELTHRAPYPVLRSPMKDSRNVCMSNGFFALLLAMAMLLVVSLIVITTFLLLRRGDTKTASY